MKFKNKIISLAVCLSFCLVALFNAVYFRDENIKTHETVMNKTDIDYMSLLEDFDEKELTVEEDKVKLDATQYLDAEFFSELDNLSYNGEIVTNSYIDYSFDFNSSSDLIIVTISFYENNELVSVETMEGVPFINEEGKTDALFVDEEEIVYLSDFADLDGFENCGLFSKLKKAVKKTVQAVTKVAKQTAVYAIGIAAVCGVVAVTAASAVASGGVTLPVGLPAAFATAGVVMAKTAIIASAVAAGGMVTDEALENSGSSSSSDTKENEDKEVKEIPTIRDDLEGKKHPDTGVPYERKTVENDKGELVSGVFPQFDSEYTAQLPEDKLKASDYVQDKECNKQLKEAVEKDPELKGKFTEEQLKDIEKGETPEGYTWHHNEEKGKMELVDEDIHANTKHTGGRNIWGGGTACRSGGCE